MTKDENTTLVPMIQANKIFSTEVRGTQYTYYLTGPIGAPEEYVDLCNILRQSAPQDEVIIRINSRGGYVSSERMIVNAIRESQATVAAFIEYDCMSAATGVFLAAHKHGWGEHIQFMAHCSWWGAIGKNPDIKSQTEFGLKQMEEEIDTTYAGFLSDQELIQCNDGKEFWFGAKELEERMGNYYAYLDEQGCDDPECSGCSLQDGDEEEDEPQFDLKDLIKQAVQEALNERESPPIAEEIVEVSKPKRPSRPKKPKGDVVVK